LCLLHNSKMKQINQQYDAFIKAHPGEMRDAILLLAQDMEHQNCKFGDQIVPTFLKPVFLSEKELSMITDVTRHIMNILEKVADLYFSHPELREYFNLNDEEMQMMEIDHGYSKKIIISRPDSFLVNGILRFVEFNCDSPAGLAYCDIQEEIFAKSFPIKEIQKKYKLFYNQRSAILLESLISTYKEFAGNNKKPNIAIVDWREMKTYNELLVLRDLFKNEGYDTVVADPRDLKFRDNRLEFEGFPIDLVYRRVIFYELIEKRDQVKDFIEAYRKGKVCVINPLRSRLASNKALLSIITDPREFREFFSEEENQIIRKHIPRTKWLLDNQTYYKDNLVSLRKHVIAHKESLVLKPSDSYGGKDVFIGRETDQMVWENLVGRILHNHENWVVQDYVDITQMTVPVLENDHVQLKTKKYNLNPFIIGGKYAGSIARLSDQSVINVSAGGGMVPAINYVRK